MNALCRYWLLVFFTGTFLIACGKTEVSDVEHVQRAKQHQVNGDFKASLIELKNALQQNPENPEARLLLGELYVLLGNGAAAEKELQRAKDLGVAGPFVEQLYIRAKLLQKEFDEVLAALDRGDERDYATLAAFQALRGEALLELGRTGEAEAVFRSILRENPDEVGALLGLARVALLSEDSGAAADVLQRVSVLDPENAESWLLKGDLARSNKDAAAALSAYQRAIELLPSGVATRLAIKARTNVTKLLLIEGKFSEAKEHVDYLLKAVPKHPVSNYLAALLAYENGDYIESRDYLLNVVNASPDYLPGLFLLGSVNFTLGNLEQAEVQLARVVTERPSLMSARLMLAEIRLRQAKANDALEVLEPALRLRPNDARLLAMAGQAALREGDLDTGRKYLKKAVAEQPNDNTLRTQLAMLYLAEGNDTQAVEELERAIAASETPGREEAMLALTYLKQENYEKAQQIAKKLAEENSDSAYPQNLLGVIFSAQGEIRQARKAFNKALELDSGFFAAALNLARLDVLEGRLAAARARLDTVLVHDATNISAMLALAQLADADQDYAQALEWLEKARGVDAAALTPRLLLMRYYLRTGKLDRARKIAREAEVIDGSDPRVLFLVGRIELGLKAYRPAVRAFEALAEQAPDAQTYYYLGVAQFRAGNVDAAESSLKQAIKLRPQHLQAGSLLVLLKMEAGQIEDAMRLVDEIKQRLPNSPAGFELEGDIQAARKLPAKAVTAYAKARELGGGSRVLLKEVEVIRRSQGNMAAVALLKEWLQSHKGDVTAHYALASAYASDGDATAAMKEYRLLLGIAPEYVPALNDLAWLLSQNGKLEEALEFAEKAYRLQPDIGVVLDTLGWIRFQLGDTKTALGLLRRAAEKMPEMADVQYHLAAALAKSGKKTESREILERILGSGHTFSSRKEAEQLLETI